MATKAERMYSSLIENFPAPGGGGAHVAFFKAGAFGYKANVPEQKIFEDVKNNLPSGGRSVEDVEITTGIAKGFAKAMHADLGGGTESTVSVTSRVPRDAFERMASAGKGATITSIGARSAIPLDFPDHEAGWRALEVLYAPDDYLFIGGPKDAGTLGDTVRTAADWIKALRDNGPLDLSRMLPHIIANPLTGLPAPTKANPNKFTFRGDNTVKLWRYMVVEFDDATIDDQLAFWSVVKLPVAALIMSGGKSVHGWVQVDCVDREEWEREIEEDIFPGYLVPMGVDGACKNESRLSRLPGHVRTDSGMMQKLIYLAPGGKAVCK